MQSLIVNYWQDDRRATPINVAASRVFLGLYILWKTLSYDWQSIQEWPVRYIESYEYLVTDTSARFLPIEAWIVAVLAVAFIAGYRIRLTSFLLASTLSHLALHRYVYNPNGGTQSFFVAVLFVVLYGLYAESDVLSLDGLRRTRELSLARLNDHLQSPRQGRHSMSILRWSLVIVAVMYFGSGLGKVISGPLLEWVQPDTIARFITHRKAIDGTARPVGEFIASSPVMSFLGAVGTIVLEFGLLTAVLFGLPLLPIVIGLVGFHLVNALALGPFFFDQVLFLLLFLAWDTGYARIVSDRHLVIAYDEDCYVCARSLYLFKILDVNDTVTFHSQYTLPAEYGTRDIDQEGAMYAFTDDETYRGFYAFRELLRQFRVFVPIVWLFRFPGVQRLGEQVYEYVALNRERRFTCNVEQEG